MKQPTNCLWCGKPIHKPHRNIRKYCSRNCKTKAGRNAIKERGETKTKMCKWCNEEFLCVKSSKVSFCSINCKSQFYKECLKKRKHPRARIWTKEKIIYLKENYPTMGSELIAKKLNLTYQQVARKVTKMKLRLSQETMREIVYDPTREYMTNNNPMKRKEVSDKVAKWWKEHPEAQLKRDTNRKITPTKPELKTQEILRKYNVSFEAYAPIKPKFVVDIKIGNIIIQVDGEYWHGHPRFEPLTEKQIKQQKRDKTQDKYLFTCGYKVIRIWERDITEENIKRILVKHNLIKVSSRQLHFPFYSPSTPLH